MKRERGEKCTAGGDRDDKVRKGGNSIAQCLFMGFFGNNIKKLRIKPTSASVRLFF